MSGECPVKKACPYCGFWGSVPDERVTEAGVHVRCPKCGHTFKVVKRPPSEEPPETSETHFIAVEAPVRKKQTGFLSSCIIVFAGVLLFSLVGYFATTNLVKKQKEHEQNIVEELQKEKYPHHLPLYTINTDRKTMTDVQMDAYEKDLIGRECIGLGRVEEVKKTMVSSIVGVFGVEMAGTIITLGAEEMTVELLLPDVYSGEFLQWDIGDTVLFVGTIAKIDIGRSKTSIAVKDVVIEEHQGE
jgi:predicted Zn finger-like uncharacterized protein